MATLALNNLAGVLECPICLDTMEDPRILPCGHTVCLGCIQKLIVGRKKEKRARCPTCRKNTKIDKPAKDLPIAYVVKDMQEHLKQVIQERAKTANKCCTPSSTAATTSTPELVKPVSEGWLIKNDHDLMSQFQERRQQEEKDRLLAEELQKQLAREVEEEALATPQGSSVGQAETHPTTSLYPNIGTFASEPDWRETSHTHTQTKVRKPWHFYNLKQWPFSDLRDAYNTSTDLEFMTVIRAEIERRTLAYTQWKASSTKGKSAIQNTNETNSGTEHTFPAQTAAPIASNLQDAPTYNETREISSETSSAEQVCAVDPVQNPLYDTPISVTDLDAKEIEEYLSNKDEIYDELEIYDTIPKTDNGTSAPKDQQPGETSETKNRPPPLPPPRKRTPPAQLNYENIGLRVQTKTDPVPPPIPERSNPIANVDTRTPVSRTRGPQKETVILPLRSSDTVEEQFLDHTPLSRAFSKRKTILIKPPEFSGKVEHQKYFRIAVMDQNSAKLGEKKIRGWWLAHFDGQREARQLDTHLDYDPVVRVAGVDDKMMCELSLEETGLTMKIGAEIQGEVFEKEWKKCKGNQYMANLGAKLASPYLKSLLEDGNDKEPQRLVERL